MDENTTINYLRDNLDNEINLGNIEVLNLETYNELTTELTFELNNELDNELDLEIFRVLNLNSDKI